MEFAVILPVLGLPVFGIIDFGHAWYWRHVMSDACREGARYGTRFGIDAANHRILSSNLSPTITDYILNTSAENGGNGGWGLTGFLPTDASPPVATQTIPSIALIPGFGSSVNLSVTTTMTCE